MTLTTRNSAKKGTQGIQTRGGSNRSNLAANSSTASLPANKRPPSKAHPKGRPPANHHDQEEEEEVSVKKRKASTISKAPRKGSTPALETDDMSLAEKMQMLKHLQKDLEEEPEIEEEDVEEEGEEDDIPPSRHHKKQRLALDDEEEELFQSLGTLPATSKPKGSGSSQPKRLLQPLPPANEEDEDAETGFDDGDGEDGSQAGGNDLDEDEQQVGEAVFLLIMGRSASKTPSRSASLAPSTASSSSKAASNAHAAATGSGSKVTEAHFSPSSRALAIAAKAQVRYQMVFGDMSDASGPKRFDFAWNAIQKAAQKSKNANTIAAFKKNSHDMAKKKNLVTFALYARTNLLSSLISKSRMKVKGSYGLTGTTDKIRSDVAWLLEDAKFMFGYQFTEVIQDQWFCSTSKSKADQETTARIIEEKTIPVTIILVTLAAIEHSLKEWKEGTKSALPFSEEAMKSSSNRHKANWNKLEMATKKWTGFWLRTLYMKIASSQSLLQAASSTTDQDLAPVDFSALDQIADASEAEGEGEEDDN
ncbi:hypothetical protein BJ912DRAFT_924479 [Pholiota molesta]|nr:hypothetical protein BJ912DRAFT_934063 [Pholiota molesta]KAF8193820.1 hypothetical protein BJ912DRAFT_924479 [Pholiota molesta]